MRRSTVISLCLVLGLTCLGFGQTTIDESTVGSAIYKIINFLLKYVVPGICGLIFIKGTVDMASGRPDAAKTMISAIVGLILALGTKAIIKLITGVNIPT